VEVGVARFFSVFFVISLFVAGAVAQVPTSGNVFIGYSYVRADLPGGDTNLNGWNGSAEFKVIPLLGLVADFSGNYGTQNSNLFFGSASVHRHNFLFGPRLGFTIGKFRPFVHALIGASHISENGNGFSNSDTSFADALGGGIDYHLIPLISWRLQIDALQTRSFSTTENDVRVSTGVVIRF
jgi:hypothetical protein